MAELLPRIVPPINIALDGWILPIMCFVRFRTYIALSGSVGKHVTTVPPRSKEHDFIDL